MSKVYRLVIVAALAHPASAVAAAATSPIAADAVSAAQVNAAAAAFGAIAGGAVAWGVAWLTRRHDAKMKAAERKSHWRRDVYMTAIEAVVAATASLARLPDRADDDPDGFSDVQAALTALSKVWVVADFPGAALTRDVADHLGSAFIRIRMEAARIQVAMRNANERRRRAQFLDEENRTAERAFHAAERAGEPVVTILKSWEKVERLYSESLADSARIHSATIELRKEYFQTLHALNSPLQELLARLVVEIRRELEVADPMVDELAFFVERQRLTLQRATAEVQRVFEELTQAPRHDA